MQLLSKLLDLFFEDLTRYLETKNPPIRIVNGTKIIIKPVPEENISLATLQKVF